MRVKNWEYLLRLVFFLVGLLLFAFGIAITIIANIGISPWDATSVGMHTLFGLTIGTWMNLQSIVLIIMGACILKERPKVSCMLTSIVMSIFVDVFVYVFQGVEINSFSMQLVVYAIGVMFVSIGCGTYLIADFSPNPIDYFMMAMKKGWCVSISRAMTFCEGTGFVFALLFRGPIGLGTFLAVIVYGPLIQFFNHIAQSVYDKVKQYLPQVVHNTVDI